MNDIDDMHSTNVQAFGLLPALNSLLTHGSVTRAAEEVGLSQPAMSRVLGRLRNVFNDPLLVRSGNNWLLTPRAEQLAESVGEVIADVDRLVRPASFEPGTSRRTFRIAVPDAVGATIVPKLLASLQDQGATCRLHLVPWPKAFSDLGAIDCAIASEPERFPGFRMESLYDDTDVLIFNAVEAGSVKSDLADWDHVAVVPAGFEHDPVDEWLGKIGVTRSIALSVPTYLQAAYLASKSGLAAVVPRRMAATLCVDLELTMREIDIEENGDRYFLLHPTRLTADPANMWLRAQIKASVCCDIDGENALQGVVEAHAID